MAFENPRQRAARLGLIACVVAAMAVSACYTGAQPTRPTSARRAGAQQTAERLYDSGMAELADGNYLDAAGIFNRVARSPRYVRYAALAAIRIGDTFYYQNRWAEAIEAYQSFISQFASNPNIPYARYRVAACYFHQMPSSWFAAPPAYENDQTMTHQAVRTLRNFLDTFPTSRFSSDVRRMLTQAAGMLVDHELYVANYYQHKGDWLAVAWRLQWAIDHYPTRAITSPNVWRMAYAYARAGKTADAVKTYGLYLEKFPKGRYQRRAHAALEMIRKKTETGK